MKMNINKKNLIEKWVEMNTPYDKPNRFWPSLLLVVLFAFFLYTLKHYNWLFYFSILLVFSGISARYIREFFRKKKDY